MEETKDSLVGKKVYLKKGNMWDDPLTGISLRNMPGSKRWKGTKETIIPPSTPAQRMAVVPAGKNLEKVKLAISLGVLEELKDEDQANAPVQPIADTPPKTKEEASERGLDYYWGSDGQMIHKDVGKTAYDILQQPEGKVVNILAGVVDLDLLKHMLSLEKEGHNMAKKPRVRVVEKLEERVKARDVAGISITKEPVTASNR